ncbi:MAG TPA: lanthionine synthetase LanC family protein [Gemmatimonadaceae bacterium]|nr:lanthionine synthetase LanC family protein [Gemmatimonadaceae bacterium]
MAGVGGMAIPRSLAAEWRRVLELAPDRPYLEAALRAERWIRGTRSDPTRLWPSVPAPGVDTFDRSVLSLYHGAPGVILFYLELHAATQERRFLDDAVRGAQALAAAVDVATEQDAGLYTGATGIAWILLEAHRASGREDLRSAARGIAARLARGAKRDGDAVWWSDSTDMVSGNAGILLGLLRLRELLGDESLDLARRAGDALLSVSVTDDRGHRMWFYDRTVKPGPEARELPNFSHGTAGIAYALATLSRNGGERRHLEAALDGAEHLVALAVPSGDGMVIRHNSLPAGENLFYLSWCHGAPGTNRLWRCLHDGDGAVKWKTLEDRAAAGVIAQGVPEQRTAGFWNNISMCCGNAGVAEYFLSRYRRSGNPADLAYAKRHADDALSRATVEGDTEKWIQAENRVSPNEVLAQTGWMQGAAGVGTMLLHMDAATRAQNWKRAVTLPDAID